ncbi:MAG TPA: stage III sporulation protein AB [Clostridiales bacterium]|nr:stage III sporulation protein AB [Clostridiales bacterium]
MLKLIGALMLIAAGTLAGIMESRRLAVRVDQLEAFLRFLSRAQTEIRFAALPVEQIVQRHGGELQFLKRCASGCSGGMPFTVAWQDSVNAAAKEKSFLPGDIDLLRSFGEGFGASDVEGQISHCELYTELIGERLKNARDEKEKKSKLYLTLGVFGGLVAALVLC